MGAPKKEAWRTSNQWPIGNERRTRFYFGGGKTGSVSSVNDGFLKQDPPEHKHTIDTYTADYSTTSGKYSRWYAVNWRRNYPNMRVNDQKALTYTTSPLDSDMEITGHPVVHLWIATDAADLDFFVYLEAVQGDKSTYLTEGILRASHRVLSKAPYYNLSLPYHRHYKSELVPIPAGEPVELVFDLLPISHQFRAGNRIRISVTCADADNFETPTLKGSPKVCLLRNSAHASFVEFPLIPAR
jgi:putative CocE/NonD family hydrolase